MAESYRYEIPTHLFPLYPNYGKLPIDFTITAIQRIELSCTKIHLKCNGDWGLESTNRIETKMKICHLFPEDNVKSPYVVNRN